MNKPTADTGSLPGTALETYGKTIPGDLGRDSIHLATIAVQSDERMFPGQHIGMTADGKASHAAPNLVGIVDPFLPGVVFPGQWFWLTLYPRTITSLRHVWKHPAFDSENTVKTNALGADLLKTDSEAWLKEWCKNNDCPSYDRVMKTIKEDWDDGDYRSGNMDEDHIYFVGIEAHAEIPDEFWVHVENVLGQPPRAKPKYFSCGC